MLLTIAIADAYAAAFEFAESDFIEKNNCMTKYHNAGCYTDDTQMSAAIAELMIHEVGPWSKRLVAGYFLRVFKRDPRSTYSVGFCDFLTKTEIPTEFIENIDAYSVRNGSAMRSVPLGLIKDKDEMLEKAKLQASLTHDTHEGIIASQAVALAVYYFVNRLGGKAGLFDYVCSETNEIFMNNKNTETECNAIDTIDAVLTVLCRSNSLTEVLHNAVQLGGDTDSVAAIACGIASFSNEYVKDFPEFLIRDLENGQYGRDYLIGLDEKLRES